MKLYEHKDFEQAILRADLLDESGATLRKSGRRPRDSAGRQTPLKYGRSDHHSCAHLTNAEKCSIRRAVENPEPVLRSSLLLARCAHR